MYVGNRIPMKLFHYHRDEPNQFNVFVTMVYSHVMKRKLDKRPTPIWEFLFSSKEFVIC